MTAVKIAAAHRVRRYWTQAGEAAGAVEELGDCGGFTSNMRGVYHGLGDLTATRFSHTFIHHQHGGR